VVAKDNPAVTKEIVRVATAREERVEMYKVVKVVANREVKVANKEVKVVNREVKVVEAANKDKVVKSCRGVHKEDKAPRAVQWEVSHVKALDKVVQDKQHQVELDREQTEEQNITGHLVIKWTTVSCK
jgi:hypothetical protein